MFGRHHHHHHGHPAFARHGFGFYHPRFGGRHGGREGGRLFDQGDLRFVILKLVADEPRHGYEIIKAIEEKVGGAYSPSPGVVYPTLTLLEEMGFIAVEPQEGGKKRYRITPEGEAALAEQSATVDAIFRRMEDVQGRFDDSAALIGRAVKNLAKAISVRVSTGSVSQAQLAAIVAAIDAATRTVETI